MKEAGDLPEGSASSLPGRRVLSFKELMEKAKSTSLPKIVEKSPMQDTQSRCESGTRPSGSSQHSKPASAVDPLGFDFDDLCRSFNTVQIHSQNAKGKDEPPPSA